MADTGQKRYNINESLNRILRVLIGRTAPNDAPGSLSGSVLSNDEALSKLAEVMENNDAEETFTLPSTVSISSATTTSEGVVELATNAEAVLGTDTVRAVTSAGVAAALSSNIAAQTEYGGIYNQATGTASINITDTFVKVTGSFTGDMPETDHITSSWEDGKITISIPGVYFVGVQTSFAGTANATINGAVFVDNVVQEPIRFRRKLGAGGDVGSASALGLIFVTGSPVDLDFRVKRDSGTGVFTLQAGQVWIFGVPGGN